ncbi:unnamed protein product [Linum tenue]|uniref:CASTOR/POLLUX/SYM8 ion channel conserved domain-containing protein n=1 Tax=Linum tenue TaxID=586396 RepID=A0AAV0K3U6_9ROSI|nr:unnamed protein product [Linum tenue]
MPVEADGRLTPPSPPPPSFSAAISSSSSTRDWFFPSPSNFVHHHQSPPEFPRARSRRFSTIPNRTSPSSTPPPPPYATRRRRVVYFPHHLSPKPEQQQALPVPLPQPPPPVDSNADRPAPKKKHLLQHGTYFELLRLALIRWHFAISASFLIAALASLLHKNLSLRNQVVDLQVSVSKARAIIVLAEDGNADQSDARALRTVLSLTGVKEGLKGHIVVELSDLDNEVLVKLVGGELVETVVAHDVIGRLMIQCARQPGLAQVKVIFTDGLYQIWEDILGFENCEFYIQKWPQLDGMQFEDVLISFPDAIPCGVKVASCGGKIVLNPDDSYALQEGDEVLVIAEDDDSYAPAALPTVWRGSLPKDFVVPKSAERILLCGWRRDMEDIIMVNAKAILQSF